MYNDYTVSLEDVNASLEATLPNFMNFYRDHGIRTTAQLVSLRDNTITGFVFPLATVLHYTTRSIGSLGILPEDPLLENMGNRILVDAVLRYEGDILGQPIWLNRQVSKDIRAYVNKHKKFTYLANAKGSEHLNGIPQVINYSDLDRSYRYAQHTGVPYQRTHNYYSTVVSHLSKMHTENSNKNHFILMDLPSIIPAPSRLRDAEAEIVRAKDPANPMSQKNYARFDSDGRFIILHLWMWAGEHKDLSIFSAWTEEELEKVNLLFTIDDHFSVLNLGVFHRWIKHGEEDGHNEGVFTNKNAQIALLRHFMSLQEIGTVAADVEIIDDESQNEIDAAKGDAPKDMTALAKNLEGELEPVTEVNVDAVGVTKTPINITAKNAVDQTSIKKAFADKTDKVDFSDDNNSVGDKELNEILGSELERDMAQLEIVEAQRDADHLNAVRDYVPYKANDFSHNGKINQLVDSLADKGLLSAAEVRRAKNLGERYKTIKSPFDESKTLEQFVEIDKETLKIPPKVPLVSRDIKGVVDKSMLDYSIKDFDNRYIKDVLNKHVVRAVLHAQQSGIAVTDMSMTRVDSYLGSHINLRCQFTPIIGRPSTVNFQLPIIDRNGIFVANGVKYKMRKQRADLPIRKVSESQVALTSNISKMFVNRTERVQFNLGAWYVKAINLLSMSDKPTITEVVYSDVFTPDISLPRTYTAISFQIASFKYKGIKFTFDHSKIEQNFPSDILSKFDHTKLIPIAHGIETREGGQKLPVVWAMDKQGRIERFNPGIKNIGKIYGSLAELLELDQTSVPVEYTDVKLKGKNIPIGVLLGFHIGFGNLLKTLGCKVRREKRRSRFTISDDEYSLVFEDEVLIFDRHDVKTALIMNGFNRVKNTIKTLSVYLLDKPDVYGRILTALGAKAQHMREYTNMFNAWIDDITRDLLIEMKEPTDLVLLFISAVEKLTDDSYKDPNGISGSYIRGYQRIAGMIHSEIATAVRGYVNAPLNKNSAIEINPKAVWFDIIQDQTVSPIEESNPIHAIKEKEVVVFRGAGGRSADSMTAKHRQFAKDSIGIVSEANVDNGSVGTITYLTANPNITSLLGTNKPIEDVKNAPAASLQSTAMLISAGSDGDDSKRVTFTNVMFTSSTFMYNSVPNRLLTGGERTIAYRTDSTWASVAQKPGTVKTVNKDGFVVNYEDGETETFNLGKHFGTWSGTTIPHEIVANVKAGQHFEKDDVLAYNKHWFQPDSLDPRQVIFKRGLVCNILMFEGRETLEDANAVSEPAARRLGTGVTEKRNVKIPFNYDVEMLLKEGDEVTTESILCNLRPPMSGYGNRYNQEAQGALDLLNTEQPKASHLGVIDRIEIIYTGEIDEMSESLQEIVSRSDAALYRKNKALGIPVSTAYVDPTYRIDNVDIGKDQVVIRYYITEHVGAGIGDKFVFGNQMKSIVSKVHSRPYVAADDGTVVDFTFSRQSISNRIVNSMDLIGTSNKFLELLEKRLIHIHHNGITK